MNILKRSYTYLIRYGFAATFKRGVSSLYRRAFSVIRKKKIYYRDDVIHLAFYPTGGLGDYIISRAVLEDIQKVNRCVISIYCDKHEYAKAVFGDIADEICSYMDWDFRIHKYDLALRAEHFVHVEGYKRSRIVEYAPDLWKRISYILDNRSSLYLDIKQQCFRERLQFERCRLAGLDRWTEQRMGEAFKIENHHVSIPLDLQEQKRWENDFRNLKYITIGYGADEMIAEKTQLKLWPKQKYEELIRLIKSTVADLAVVQLGDAKAERIAGADIFVLGEGLEYVKHILKGGICHVDCEGGLVHLATQLGTKCIVLFGPTPVHMYGYESNINIVSKSCSNCMGLHDMWAYECIRYKGKSGDAVCMNGISSMQVYDELMKVIDL